MSLHSVSIMVVVPLVLTVGAALLLTPRDILRQPVIATAGTEPLEIPDYTITATTPPAPIAVVEFKEPAIQPASLVVVASAPRPPSIPETADAGEEAS